MPGKRYWRIEGYDGLERTFEKVVPVGRVSENAVVVLLQRLASKHLDEDEIVSSSLNRAAAGRTRHLEPQRGEGNPRTITVGEGQYYVASVRQDA